jgi:hypothetical protein
VLVLLDRGKTMSIIKLSNPHGRPWMEFPKRRGMRCAAHKPCSCFHLDWEHRAGRRLSKRSKPSAESLFVPACDEDGGELRRGLHY